MSSKTREPFILITSLPDDVIVDILARVPRCNYPSLSLVSKHFRSLVSSPELYARRITLGCTEACIYVLLYNPKTTSGSRWYTLLRKTSGNRLVLIQSLHRMCYNAGFAAVGSKIYVVGKPFFDMSTLAIDCKSHTFQPLPNMPVPMDCTASGVIDGKIYVIGFINDDLTKNVLEVFNIETQMWEPEVTKLEMERVYKWYGCVVMDDKMYMKGSDNSFFYKPKERKWETDEMLNSEDWKHACVLDDVLYYFDCYEKTLRAYDLKQKCWGKVKGLEDFFPEGISSWWSYTVSYGGKLALLLSKEEEEDSSKIKQIWFVEIAIERRQGGEIWGKAECKCNVVFEGNMILVHSLVVMV